MCSLSVYENSDCLKLYMLCGNTIYKIITIHPGLQATKRNVRNSEDEMIHLY